MSKLSFCPSTTSILLLVWTALATVSGSRLLSGTGSSDLRYGSPRPLSYAGWSSLFPQDRTAGTPAGMWPEKFSRDDAIRLARHLKSHSEDLKRYNQDLCPAMTGEVFTAVASLSSKPEHLSNIRRYLFNPECMSSIPDATWSMLTVAAAKSLSLSIDELPKAAVPVLTWNVFKTVAKNHLGRERVQPTAYNGWCRLVAPWQFSTEIWTGQLWHLLTPECIADMAKPSSQRSAVVTLARKDMSRTLDDEQIRDVAFRLTRLQAVKRVAKHLGQNLVFDQIEVKTAEMIGALTGLRQKSYTYVQNAIPEERRREVEARIRCMDSITEFCSSGASHLNSHVIISEFIANFKLDALNVFTWEFLSKYVVKDPSRNVLLLIAELAESEGQRRLPMDSILNEAVRIGSAKVVRTVVDCTDNHRQLEHIRVLVSANFKAFGSYNVDELLRLIDAAIESD